jgi:DNA polymerase I
MSKTLIIDGHNAGWRLAKRMPMLTTNGRPVQVVYGLLTMMHGLLEQFTPDVAIMCWDTGHSAYRKRIFPSYKANRHQFEDKKAEQAYSSTIAQMKEAEAILAQMNVAQLIFPKTEGDDLMAMVCQQTTGWRTVVSSDMDMFQLIGDGIDVWSPVKTTLYNRSNFRQKEGLSAQQFLQLRAAVGDVSDNIPGIARGMGDVTIRQLLAKYESIDRLFEPKIEKKVVKMGTRYASLYTEGARQAYFRNLLLMDLSISSENHPEKEAVTKAVQEAVSKRMKIDIKALKQLFIENSFQSLLRDFAKWTIPFQNLDSE